MSRVLVAGATGYLGRYLVEVLHERGYWVRALTRSANKLDGLASSVDDMFVGEVTKPETLKGVADGVDVVISAIGITRQKDGLTYMDVDYQGNVNLMHEAQAAGVKRFLYVSALGADQMLDLKIAQAKEKFVAALGVSGLDCTILRPGGYFSDMREFLEMARRGRVWLFDGGRHRLNPIHGRDVAEVCADAIETNAREVSFGGPEVYTHREAAEAAFAALGKPPRISSLPGSVARAIIRLLRVFTSSRFYGPVEFLLTVLTRDVVGVPRGKITLEEFFAEEAKKEASR